MVSWNSLVSHIIVNWMACVSATHVEIQQRLGSTGFSSHGFCPNGRSQLCACSVFCQDQAQEQKQRKFKKNKEVCEYRTSLCQRRVKAQDQCVPGTSRTDFTLQEGDDSSGQFRAVLFMLGQAPQQRSQASIQPRLETLMYTRRSQGEQCD